MVYQNNNNRIVPKATEDRDLKPAATAQNKLVQYQPDLTKATAWKGNAQALASIGQGLMDIDTMWRIQSQENAIKAVWETEAKGGNKKEWKQVSKNIKGAAIFNPYNDDAYRQLQAQDIYRAAALELSSTPELEKTDPDKYYQLVQDTNKKMIEAFKQTGLSPRDYGDSLVQWDSNMKKLEGNYIVKHAEYKYKQLATKQSSDLSLKAGVNLMENPDLDKSIVLKDTINTKIEELNELGIPADTQAKILISGMRGFLAKNADMITGAEFRAAVSEIEIDGQPLRNIIDNYDYQVQQLYKEAQRAIYDDKNIEYQNHQLDLQMASQDAMKDMYNWTKQNPNASFQDVLSKTQEVVTQYGLEELGFNFIKQMASDKQTLMNMNEIQSDPSVLQEFGAKAALGTLTGNEVNQAILDGNLNWKDGLQFTDRLNKELKADMTAVKTSFTELQSKLNKTGIYGKALGADSQAIKDINAQANQLVLDLREGRIKPDEAKQGMQDLERIAQAKAQLKEFRATNDSFLLNKNYIISQHAPAYNAKPAIDAFKQLGLERGQLGQKINPQVTSAPNDNRKINGKLAPHKGYDLGATSETRIHTAPMDGVCIFAGKNDDFGNYAVIKYSNGTYMRVGHLSTSTTHLQGKRIPAGGYIGKAGSTGYSTGIHLHVDFWNKNREIISVERFQRGIR
jgi:murein DD-endopeptidase MepM/ murein hydrolase activator NlpD